MAVDERDLRHIASLARLGLDAERVPELVRELNGILDHMAVLAAVDPSRLEEKLAADGDTPLRADRGPSQSLERPRESFAPLMRDGFFLVPRLASHQGASETSPADDEDA